MSHDRDTPPTEWSPLKPLIHVGADIYVHVGADVVAGDKGTNVLVYHWHTPDICRHCGSKPDPDGDHSCPCPFNEDCPHHPSPDRWDCSRCTLHDVISIDPLHLEASLACEDGCPSHGWIRDGKWVPA